MVAAFKGYDHGIRFDLPTQALQCEDGSRRVIGIRETGGRYNILISTYSWICDISWSVLNPTTPPCSTSVFSKNAPTWDTSDWPRSAIENPPSCRAVMT